jgi:isocitrate lyase
MEPVSQRLVDRRLSTVDKKTREMATQQERAELLKKEWASNPRWKGVKRPYSAEEVTKISGSVKIEYTLAKNGAEKLWDKLHTDSWVSGLGALTGNQAIQEVSAGMKAIYLSGWQVVRTSQVRCIRTSRSTRLIRSHL